ncbi:MAG: hypothetical protein ACRC20_06905 [Segniliparus sp.]|uniref:hypothetical protein n=1 Tax=Segniliparus sp. TaxID=2804064 RepID=UPI003F412A15
MRRALLVLPLAALALAGCDDVRKGAASATTTQLAVSSSSQAPSTARTNAAPTTSASTGAGADAGLSAFVGVWNGHGRVLTVGADGAGKIVARTYQKCGDPGVSSPCDTFDGDEIKPGAVTQIKLTGAHEAVDVLIADFTVGETTLDLPPDSTGTLVLNQAHGALQITINGKQGDGYYCGPKADPGYCGA